MGVQSETDMLARWLVVFYFSMAASAQPWPMVSIIGNAAGSLPIHGGQLFPLPQPYPIARGSLFYISGRFLGPAEAASTPLPTTLTGTSVTIQAASGARIPAFVVSISSSDDDYGRINALLPSTVPEGPADVTVTVNGRTSWPARVLVHRSRFAIFTKSGRPVGPAFAHNVDPPDTFPMNGFATAAQPGQDVIIWGTGLGPSGEPDQEPATDNTVFGPDLEIQVGARIVKPIDARRAPGLIGIDEIRFRLPDDPAIVNTCFLPVTVRTAGISGNTVTIAGSAGPQSCKHPLELPDDLLKRLDNGESVNVAGVNFVRSVSSSSVDERAFLGVYWTGMVAEDSNTEWVKLVWGKLPPPGQCLGRDLGQVGAPQSLVVPRPLPFTLISPSGKSYTLSPVDQTPIEPGIWTVTNAGRDSSVTINVPPPSFKWKFRDDGILTWTGAGEGDHDYVIGSYLFSWVWRSGIGGVRAETRYSETICTALGQSGEGKVYGNIRNSKVLGLVRPSPPGLPADIIAFVYTQN